jgi:hypothetical protein
MGAWLARRTARWRVPPSRWLPPATAVAQGALVACALLSTSAYTLGYLGRLAGTGGRLADLGRFTEVAELTAVLASLVAYLVVVPMAWWLIWASRRRMSTEPDLGRSQWRIVWRRIGLLGVAVFGPPLVGAVVTGERALTVAPAWTLAEVPLAALALWALGAYLLLGYWMRRVCLRVGLVGLAIHLVVRRVKLLPTWMVEWPTVGGALRLSDAEAQYLVFFTLSVMAFGFVVLGTMMLAARPLMTPGPVILTPPPVPQLPGPIPTSASARPPEPVREFDLPRYSSGRVMRRLDI